MTGNRIIFTAAISISVLTVQWGFAQGAPGSGLYQIMSGRYTECCGIGGARSVVLPYERQAFIELTVDLDQKTAKMGFLGDDAKTVYTLPTEGPRAEFIFQFTNGIVFSDHIEFGDLIPVPGQMYFRYTVTNSGDTLRINGMVDLPCPGCADFFTEFSHTNVLAAAQPTPTIRMSEVEVCWDSVSNRNYQLQFRSTLTGNLWTNLGGTVMGNGSKICLTDKVPAGEPQRFYRVISLP